MLATASDLIERYNADLLVQLAGPVCDQLPTARELADAVAGQVDGVRSETLATVLRMEVALRDASALATGYGMSQGDLARQLVCQLALANLYGDKPTEEVLELKKSALKTLSDCQAGRLVLPAQAGSPEPVANPAAFVFGPRRFE